MTAQSGLTAIIALHSTHLGPAAGGTRFWHYADPADAMRDALRLSRGMSYKNAMAGLPMGGGKAVILARRSRGKKTAAMLARFRRCGRGAGRALCHRRGRRHDARPTWSRSRTRTEHVCGLPAEEGDAGGDPGPVHGDGHLSRHQGRGGAQAGQGQHAGRACGRPGLRQRRRRRGAAAGKGWRAADPGRYRSDKRAEALAHELGGEGCSRRCRSWAWPAMCSAPTRWARSSMTRVSPGSIARSLQAARTTSWHGPNTAQQLARARHPLCARLCDQRGRHHQRQLEYLCRRDGTPCDINEVRKRIAQIPARLAADLAARATAAVGSSDEVADRDGAEADRPRLIGMA